LVGVLTTKVNSLGEGDKNKEEEQIRKKFDSLRIVINGFKSNTDT
jgi:hypothetical protein